MSKHMLPSVFPAVLDREKLFDTYGVNEYYPLEKLNVRIDIQLDKYISYNFWYTS